jgi:hypothetical protein
MSFTLRDSTDGDWPAILRVANEALPQAPDGNAGWVDARKTFDTAKRQRRHHVAEAEGQIIAYGGVEETGDGRWRMFVVMSADRLRNGTGDTMLRQLLQDIHELGGSVAWLREQADDVRFLEFLLTRGFVETKRFVVRDGGGYDGVEVVELESGV